LPNNNFTFFFLKRLNRPSICSLYIDDEQLVIADLDSLLNILSVNNNQREEQNNNMANVKNETMTLSLYNLAEPDSFNLDSEGQSEQEQHKDDVRQTAAPIMPNISEENEKLASSDCDLLITEVSQMPIVFSAEAAAAHISSSNVANNHKYHTISSTFGQKFKQIIKRYV
jgi:hypothetical protein